MSTANTAAQSLRIVIIGAGMAGILAAIRLREAGKHQVVVYEKADRVGGTWRENIYPGAGCDIPSHLYSYSFAPNPDWPEVYSAQPDILAYIEGVVDRHELASHIRLGAEVVGAAFVIDLPDLGGLDRIVGEGVPAKALVAFEGD